MFESVKKLLTSEAPILVAFSGGKDSIAMVLHLLELGVSRDRIHLHHHDVDGGPVKIFDWQCTESYCLAFAKALGLKLYFSYRKGGIMREVDRNNEAKQDVYFQKEPGGEYFIAPSDKNFISTRLKFPGVSANLMTRWCSSVAKIDVLRTAIRNNSNYIGEIYILTGERRQESANRAKYAAEEMHAINCKSRPTYAIRIIIDWTESQVWEIIQRWKIQPHPAYVLGWSRCSCQLCIFSDPNIWATIAKISPEKVEVIANKETEISFTLYDKQSIHEVIAKGQVLDTLSDYWVSQATGIFTAPIIVPGEWLLPSGAFKTQKAGSV